MDELNPSMKLFVDLTKIMTQTIEEIREDIKMEFRNDPLLQVGDMAWVLHRNNMFTERVASIQQYYTKEGKDLYYIFEGMGTVPASYVYRSKQDLIEAQIIHWKEELAKLKNVNSQSK
jgi:hypothetical protein